MTLWRAESSLLCTSPGIGGVAGLRFEDAAGVRELQELGGTHLDSGRTPGTRTAAVRVPAMAVVYGVSARAGTMPAVALASFTEPVAPSELTKRSSWLVPMSPTASTSVDCPAV